MSKEEQNNGTYKLSIFERLRLLNDFLPKAQGNFLTLKMANETIMKIGVTQAEIEEYGLQSTEDGSLRFNQEKMFVDGDVNKPVTKEFDIPKSVVECIAKELKEKDAQENLGFETYTIYEKFVENNKGEGAE